MYVTVGSVYVTCGMVCMTPVLAYAALVVAEGDEALQGQGAHELLFGAERVRGVAHAAVRVPQHVVLVLGAPVVKHPPKPHRL